MLEFHFLFLNKLELKTRISRLVTEISINKSGYNELQVNANYAEKKSRERKSWL